MDHDLAYFTRLDGVTIASVQATYATTIEVEREERPALYAEWIVRLVFDS